MSSDRWSPAPNEIRILEHDVHVWRMNLQITPAEENEQRACLSNEEIQRADRFRFSRHRRRFVASHAFLRAILSRYTGIPAHQIAYCLNPFGKPALLHRELDFNLSHSHEMALLAVTQARRVGVDLEWIREGVDIDSIAQRFFSTRESNELIQFPGERKKQAFFHCWTRKEAFIKAVGEGLSIPLDHFDVSIQPEDREVALRIFQPGLTGDWRINSLPPGEGYAAALAVEGPPFHLHQWNWGG